MLSPLRTEAPRKARRESKVEQGSGEVEAALGQAEAGGGQPDQLDELGVGAGDRLDLRATPAGVADPDAIAAVGVDGLDVGLIEEPLEWAQAEQQIVHGPGDFVLVDHRKDLAMASHRRASLHLKCLIDELPGKGTLISLVQRWRANRLIGPASLRQPLGHLVAYP